MRDNIPISELRMIRGYKDIKDYLYKLKNNASKTEERKFYSELVYELYEADYSLCGWIEEKIKEERSNKNDSDII